MKKVGVLTRKNSRQSSYLCTVLLYIGRSKFLQFCTGAGSIPPIGLTKPTITVTLNSESNGIYASTCLQTLYLPKFASRDDFTLALNMSIFDETFNEGKRSVYDFDLIPLFCV